MDEPMYFAVKDTARLAQTMEDIEKAIAHGVDPHHTDIYGVTLAHLLAERDKGALLVQMAEKYPFILEQRDCIGLTVAIRLALNHNVETVLQLAELQPDVLQQRSSHDYTVLGVFIANRDMPAIVATLQKMEALNVPVQADFEQELKKAALTMDDLRTWKQS